MSHKKNHPIDSAEDHDVTGLADGEILQRSGTALASAGVTPAQIALLDQFGKLFVSQLPASVMEYHGQWDAATNTPTLSDATGDAGSVYLVSVAGTTDFGSGPIEFAAGDWAIHNGTVWEKSVNTNLIQSVNGLTGTVVLDGTDIETATASGITVKEKLDEAESDIEAITYIQPKVHDSSDAYTLVLSDASTAIEMDRAGANTVTVPSIAFPVGTVIEVLQIGTGQTSIVADTGVTVQTSETLKLRKQYSSVVLRKRATDTWILSGDTESA